MRVMATGRSDYPNQINNVLAFPGIFRGALDVRATAITEEMKLAAARGIAVGGGRRRARRGLHHPERLQPRRGPRGGRRGGRGGRARRREPTPSSSRPSSGPPSPDAGRRHRRDRHDRPRGRRRAARRAATRSRRCRARRNWRDAEGGARLRLDDAERARRASSTCSASRSPSAGRTTPSGEIRDSRILVHAQPRRRRSASCRRRERPKVLVSQSGAGCYGAPRRRAGSTSRAPRGDDFLAQLSADWEAEARAGGGARRAGGRQPHRDGALAVGRRAREDAALLQARHRRARGGRRPVRARGSTSTTWSARSCSSSTPGRRAAPSTSPRPSRPPTRSSRRRSAACCTARRSRPCPRSP